MPVSSYFQQKLGITDATASPTITQDTRPEGFPIGGATKVPTRTPAPTNSQGIKALGNLSGFLGGGQYNIGTDANAVIKSPRVTQETFVGRQKARGPYIGSNVGIDHIVPISLGGSDDPTNIQILPKPVFDKKTVVDDLAAFLYQKGKIPLGMARNLNKNWNNSPANLLDIKSLMNDPTLNTTINFSGGGSFNIKDAIKKIQSDPIYTSTAFGAGSNPQVLPSGYTGAISTKVTPGGVLHEIGGIEGGIEKALNVVEGAIGAPVYGALEGIVQGKNPFKAAADYFTKAASGQEGVFSQPIFKQGLRSFTKEASLGYINNTSPINYSSPSEATVGKVIGAFAGAAGFVTSLEGLGSLFRVVGVGATGIGALDTALAQTRIPQMVEAIGNTTLAKSLSASPLMKSMIETGGLFAARGQLGAQEPGQFFNLQSRAQKLVGDLANGAFYGLTGGLLNMKLAGSSIPTQFTVGTLANTYLGYVISKMQGASNQDALLNGAVFGVLHGTGLYGNLGKTMEDIQQTATEKGPLAGMKDFYENHNTLRGQQIAKQTTQDFFTKFGYTGKVNTDTQINAAVNHVKDVLAQEVADGNMTHEQAGPLFQQAVMASRYIHLQNVPLKDQIKQQLRDIGSAFSTRPAQPGITPPVTPTVVDTSNADNYLNNVRNNAVPAEPLSIPNITDNRFMSTGMADTLTSKESKIANANQRAIVEALKTNPEAKIDVVLERDPNHVHSGISDPNAIKIIASVDGGPGQFVGYVPQERNIRENQNNPNGKPQDFIPFNPATNKDTIAQQMDAQGLTHVHAQLETGGIGMKSDQPFMILSVPSQNWGEAMHLQTSTARATTAPEVVPTPGDRQEFFSSMPDSLNKSMADAVFGKIEDNVRGNDAPGLVSYLNSLGDVVSPEIQAQIENNLGQLKYGDVLQLLRNSESIKALNPNGEVVKNGLVSFLQEFLASHGKDGLQKFSNTLISGDLARPNELNIPETTPTIDTTPTQTVVATTDPSISSEEIMAKMPPEVQSNTVGKALNIFLNKAIAEGDRPVVSGDYKTFNDNGKLGGISKRVTNRILELLNNGVDRSNPQIEKLYKFYNSLSRPKVQLAAKATDTFEEFLSHYVKKADDVGIQPFDPLLGNTKYDNRFYDQYNNKQIQELQRRYLELKQAPSQVQVLQILPKGKTIADGVDLKPQTIVPNDPSSLLGDQIQNSKEGKLKDDKGNPMIYQMRMLTDNNAGDRFAGGVQLSGRHPQQVEAIANAMQDQNIFFLTNQNGVPTTSQGIYISPEMQTEFVKRYDANPKTYEITDPEILKLMEKDKVDNNFKTMQVFFRDVLGAGNNFDAAALFKRINLIDDRSIKWDVPGKVRVLFMPDTELKSIEAPGFAPPNFNAADPQAEGYLKKTLEDGGRLAMPELQQQIQFYMGNTTESSNTKGTIAIPLPDAQGLIVEKGNTGTLDAATRVAIERKYGITLQPNDIISFQTNVKMGKKNLQTHPDNPDIKVYEVPKNNMRFLYQEASNDPTATFSLSLLGKFSKKDMIDMNGESVPVHPYVTALFAPQAKLWVDTRNSVINDGANPVDALTTAYGKNMEELGYGKLKTMAANKASIIKLQTEFDRQMNKIAQDTIFRNRDLQGAHLKLTPDLGFYDPNTNQRRYLAARQGVDQMGEVMISRDQWNALGKPEFMLAGRYPVTKLLALTKVKVLIGEDYGKTQLGMDNVILNTHDVFAIKEGDHDGDSIHLINIIPKDKVDQLIADGKPLTGIPDVLTNFIEQERNRYIQQHGPEYGTQGIEANPYPKYPAALLDGRLDVSKKATEAKQAVGGISNASNMMKMFTDNIGDTKIQQIFTVNGKVYQPRADFATQDRVGQILQSAVDGTKSQTFSQLSPIDKNAFSAIFDVQDPKVLSALWSNISKSYGIGFKLGNTQYRASNDLIKNAQDFLTATLPTDPNAVHPFQEVLQPFQNAALSKITVKEMWDSDLYATEQVKKEIPKPEETSNSKAFEKFFLQDWLPKKLEASRSKAPNSKELRNGQPVYDYYWNNYDRFSAKDRQAISYFLVTSKEANQWYDPNFEAKNKVSGFHVERFDDLMLPEHQQAYNKAQQDWYTQNVGQKAPEAQISTPEPPSTPPPAVPAPSSLEQPSASLPTQQFPNMAEKFTTKKGVELAKQTNPDGSIWLQQNTQKPSRWTDLAKKGHQIEHLMLPNGGGWGGKIRIDGKEYTYNEATKKFLGH